MNYVSFDEIHLLRKEKLCLFSFHFYKKQKPDTISCFQSLYSDYGFLKLNSTGLFDETGCEMFDGTYSISDRYYRYKIHRREWTICHLPNWVAIVISLIPYVIKIIESLLKQPEQLAKWISPLEMLFFQFSSFLQK